MRFPETHLKNWIFYKPTYKSLPHLEEAIESEGFDKYKDQVSQIGKCLDSKANYHYSESNFSKFNPQTEAEKEAFEIVEKYSSGFLKNSKSNEVRGRLSELISKINPNTAPEIVLLNNLQLIFGFDSEISGVRKDKELLQKLSNVDTKIKQGYDALTGKTPISVLFIGNRDTYQANVITDFSWRGK